MDSSMNNDFDMMDISAMADSNFESRDMADFEEIYFSSEEDEGIFNEDEAVYRGLGACELQDTFRGLSELDSSLGHFEGLKHLAPKPQSSQKNIDVPNFKLKNRVANSPPSLTDQIGYLSCDRLFCGKSEVSQIMEALNNVFGVHNCALNANKNSPYSVSVSHFSQEYLSLEFEVNVWDVSDSSLHQNILPHCPCESRFVVEFNKVSGCSVYWKRFFAKISSDINASIPAFVGPAPKQLPKLNDHILLEDDDFFIIEEESSCYNDMIQMLYGTYESQQAAASAIAQSCVTTQGCSQLISSGFLEAAQKILCQYALHKDNVPHAQLPLLRCILLVISTVISCTDEFKTAVCQNGDMKQCLSSLQATNPSIFTHELVPLTQVLEVC